jgi:hypothetical protein
MMQSLSGQLSYIYKIPMFIPTKRNSYVLRNLSKKQESITFPTHTGDDPRNRIGTIVCYGKECHLCKNGHEIVQKKLPLVCLQIIRDYDHPINDNLLVWYIGKSLFNSVDTIHDYLMCPNTQSDITKNSIEQFYGHNPFFIKIEEKFGYISYPHLEYVTYDFQEVKCLDPLVLEFPDESTTST